MNKRKIINNWKRTRIKKNLSTVRVRKLIDYGQHTHAFQFCYVVYYVMTNLVSTSNVNHCSITIIIIIRVSFYSGDLLVNSNPTFKQTI